MNISVDATALYGRYSGVEYSLWNLLGGLNVVDTENLYTVYIPHDGPPEEHLSSFGARWRWVRLPFDGGDKARRVLWQQTQLPLALARDGCKLLHSPTYVSPALSPVPVVLTVYDLIALTHPPFATRLNRVHYRALLPRSIERARRVIVPSKHVQEEIARCVPSAISRTRIVPLALEPAFLTTYDECKKRPCGSVTVCQSASCFLSATSSRKESAQRFAGVSRCARSAASRAGRRRTRLEYIRIAA
jgi:hypothetical protein